MLKRRYSYTVLRYVHDPLTAEFANVGLVLVCPGQSGLPSIVKAGTQRTIGRMRDMFPDLDRAAFSLAMRTIDKMLSRVSERVGKEGMLVSEGDAASFARGVLPADDSSLQWSPLGSGLTDNPDETFRRLFARFVTRYDTKSLSRRTDEEVWKPVRQRLEERNILVDLEPKTIIGGDDEIQFEHAWKNGAWHVYEPISLDLADADGIYKKAHRWLGQLASVAPYASEPFHSHFIVGAPTDPALEDAYHRALKILRKSPGPVDVYEEADIEHLVDRIEDDVRSHREHERLPS